jgi:hypothetical protein
MSGPTFWSTALKIEGDHLLVELRTGRVLDVDVTSAAKSGQAIVVHQGEPVNVSSVMKPDGSLDASFVWRAPGQALWGQDRPQ